MTANLARHIRSFSWDHWPIFLQWLTQTKLRTLSFTKRER